MAKLSSTNGVHLAVETSDLPILARWKWHVQTTGGTITYASAKIGPKRVYLHHLVLGTPPDPKLRACAIDRDLCHVELRNLAWVEPGILVHRAQRPKQVRSDTPTSPYRGVTWDPREKAWKASLNRNGKQYWLGLHASDLRAAEAYDEGARRVMGPWAMLNFPRPDDPVPEGTFFPPPGDHAQASDGAALLLDAEDAPLIARHRWALGPHGYETKVGTAVIPLALLVMGPPPSAHYRLMHQDGDLTNLIHANLQWIKGPSVSAQRGNATRVQGKLLGVRRTPAGRFSASVRTGNKERYLGVVDTEEEAAQRYDQAALEVFGPRAATNAQRQTEERHAHLVEKEEEA